MIYWETSHPKFQIYVPLQCDVWTWEAPQGWVDIRRYPWSPAMSEIEAATAIRERLQPPRIHEDYLVIYGRERGRVSLILVGTKDRIDAYGDFGTQPPDWWLGESLTEMELFLARVVLQRDRVTALLMRDRFAATKELRGKPVEGYCNQCGLPLTKHVSHDPPGIAKPASNSDAQAWAPYFAVLEVTYAKALQTLTDEELIKMPDILNKRRLRVLELEIKERLKDPKHQPRSRMDRLLEDSDV